MNIAINGFGRIGRMAFKTALEKGINVVAINDLTDTKTLATLLKFDSVYGVYKKKIDVEEKALIIDGKKYPVYSEKDPMKLPWGDLAVDVVLECTGVFDSGEKAKAHIEAGAKRVIISAPAKDEETPTYIIGVNEKEYQGEEVISMASCTTNCIAPIAKIMEDNFGVEKAMMTTTHAYTADQNLVDGPHKDMRRGRAAAHNIVPTTTGAAIATTKTIPSLKDKFDGISVRVPVICGSLSDFTFLLKRKTTKEEINKVFLATYSDPVLSKILYIYDDPIVSSDIVGTSYSAVLDLDMTKIVDGDLVKILAWYDNEMGYSTRLVEMCEIIANK